jgi:hypothetical protein
MPVTPIYSFPYPGDSDPPDGASQIEDLAESVETAVSTLAATVTADRSGKLLGAPTNGASNVGFSGETVIDNNTFTHTQNRYEELVFASTFSLNTSGVALIRVRYTSGTGPITAGSTLMHEMVPTGSGSNNQLDITRLLNSTFRALSSGTYTIGITAQAAAGASSGTMNGAGAGAARDLYVKDAGPV